MRDFWSYQLDSRYLVHRRFRVRLPAVRFHMHIRPISGYFFGSSRSYTPYIYLVFYLLVGCQAKVDNSIIPIEIIQNFKDNPDQVIRFAKLEIDSARLEDYLIYLKEGIETSIATETGVLTMYFKLLVITQYQSCLDPDQQ